MMNCRHYTDQGWLFVAAIKDMAPRGIVGWAMEGHICAELCCEAPKKALVHRKCFKTRSQATAMPFDCIAVFYNRHRRHSAINDKTPQQALRGLTWKMATLGSIAKLSGFRGEVPVKLRHPRPDRRACISQIIRLAVFSKRQGITA